MWCMARKSHKRQKLEQLKYLLYKRGIQHQTSHHCLIWNQWWRCQCYPTTDKIIRSTTARNREHAHCTRTSGEHCLRIQGPQSQSRRADGKSNSAKVQHQEENGKPTTSKPKGATKKDICDEGYDKDGYPVIYCHTHSICRNLTHGRMKWEFLSNTHKKEATVFNQIGGSAVTNKPKPKKWQVGSGGNNRLINNINCSINQSQPCANQNTLSETPPVDAQTTNKTHCMDSKYPNFLLLRECTGVQSRERVIP